MEEDLPESYADLAKRVYAMAEKEGWSREKVFELLKDPEKLVKKMEHVWFYFERLLDFRENLKDSKNQWNLSLKEC